MLRSVVKKFSDDLNKISEHIKIRTVWVSWFLHHSNRRVISWNFRSQIRTTLKKKAFEDAGLPVRSISNVQPTQTVANTQAMLNKSEVTLNMLNAPESEVDVEGLHEDVKLEFDGATEEVASWN